MTSGFKGSKEKSSEQKMIMAADTFCTSLKRNGVNLASGVPCAVQKYIIDRLVKDAEIPYVQAAREEDAIGIGVGAYLAGKKPIILMQNSGLANCMNAFASLLLPYRIPLLFLVTWRGCPGEDAPQHFVMGRATTGLLEVLGVPFSVLSMENVETTISNSTHLMQEQHVPVVMLIRRGTFE